MGSAGKEGDTFLGHTHSPEAFIPPWTEPWSQGPGRKDWSTLPSASSRAFALLEKRLTLKKTPRLSVPSCDIASLAAAFLAIDEKRLLV